MFRDGTKSFLTMTSDLFQKSVDTVQTNVSETPTEFSQTIVDNLRVISETAILPVAGLILTSILRFTIYALLKLLTFTVSVIIILIQFVLGIIVMIFSLGAIGSSTIDFGKRK